MAKEVAGLIKLQVKGGAANPSPPIGPALGAKGVNIMEFCKKFNAATQDKAGKVLPVVITVYGDKSFDFIIKTPPAAVQIMDAAKIKGGSGVPHTNKVGSINWEQIKAIADAVTERIRERLQERPWHVEGYEGRQWVLLDYVDLVVHIFSTDKRQFYDLERLWGDAPRELIDAEADVAEANLLKSLRANGATSS